MDVETETEPSEPAFAPVVTPVVADETMSSAPSGGDDQASPIAMQSPLRKRKAHVLSEALENSCEVLGKAVDTITMLRIEKEEISQILLNSMSDIRADNLKLREKIALLESTGKSNAKLANSRIENAKASRDKVGALESDLTDLKTARDRLEREKLEMEQRLVERMRQSAADGEVIQQLRTQVADLIEYRLSAESTIAEQSTEATKLVRDSETRAAQSAGTARRCKFLEAERVRLSASVVEARSQHEIAAAEHAAQLKSLNGKHATLRAEVLAAKAREETQGQEIAALHAQIKNLQQQRDQSRESALTEVNRMKDIMKTRIEAAQDAEARAEKYKNLLQTVSDNNKHMVPKMPPSRKSLDAAAEALLKDIQKTLDEKLEDLKLQRQELQKARLEKVQVASKFEGLVRVAQEAKRERDSAAAVSEAALKTAAELKKRVAILEERILLAGSPQLPIRTPRGSDYGGNRTTPMSAPRSRYTMEEDEAEPDNLTGAMSTMNTLQQQHQAILAALASRRAGATPMK